MGGNKSLHGSATSTGTSRMGSADSMIVETVRVVDVVLSEDHPKSGGKADLGKILYIPLFPKNPEGQTTENPAYPLFPMLNYIPLKGEIVTIVRSLHKDQTLNWGKRDSTKSNKEAIDRDRENFTEVTSYYFPTMGIQRTKDYNASPYSTKVDKILTGEVNQSSINLVESGTPLNSTNIGANSIHSLGKYFDLFAYNNKKIFPLTSYEGDFILESRTGSSIRFGMTTPTSFDLDSIETPYWSRTSLNNKSTILSQNPDKTPTGSIGDPIIIIRNGQRMDTQGLDNNTSILEDINHDDSSIYMTSNQSISNFNVNGVMEQGNSQLLIQDSYFTNLNEDGTIKSEKSPVQPNINETKIYEQQVNEQMSENGTADIELLNTYTSDPYKTTVTNASNSVINLNEVNEFLLYNKTRFNSEGEINPNYSDLYFEKLNRSLFNVINSGVLFATSANEKQTDTPTISPIDSQTDSANSTFKIEEDESNTQQYIDRTQNGIDPNITAITPTWNIASQVYRRDYGYEFKKRLNFFGDLNPTDKTQINLRPKFFRLKGKQGSTITVHQPSLVPNPRKILASGHHGPLGFKSRTTLGHSSARNIKYLMIHCTGSPKSSHPLDIIAGQIYSEPGVNTFGGNKAGYHILISEDGKITRVYQDSEKCYGAQNSQGERHGSAFEVAWNNESVHIAWIGGKDWVNERPTPFQAETLKELCLYYVRRYPTIKIVGHNQVFLEKIANTCPMFYVPSFTKEIGIGQLNTVASYGNAQAAIVDNNFNNLRIEEQYYGLTYSQLLKIYKDRGKALGEGKGGDSLPL